MCRNLQRRILFVVLLGLTVSAALGAEKTWTGAVNSNFSEAGNWSPSAPGTGDTAVFNDTSAVNCTIDQNTELAALRIEGTYAGTVSGGSAVLTLNTGDFDAANGHFSAGTGTIKFTGAASQDLMGPNGMNLNVVINAKSGGALKLSYNNWNLARLDLRAGTTTRIPPFRNTDVDDLLIQGTAGNLATIKSYNTGSAYLVVADHDSYDIDYAHFEYVNGSRGIRLYADNSSDGGGNVEVDFATYDYCTWIGGTSSSWADSSNWRPGVPQSISEVHFSSYSSNDCVVDVAQTDIASLEIESDYAGTLSGGSAVIAINSGNFGFDGGSCFQPQNSTVKFTGTGSQTQYFGYHGASGSLNFNVLENAQTGGQLRCQWLLRVNTNLFRAQAGTTTKLSHCGHYLNTDALELLGTDTAPLTLKTTSDGSVTRFALSNVYEQQIAYATIQDIDASGGARLYAGSTSTDGGNNSNVDFGGDINKTWTGLGSTNSWSEAANWSDNEVPVVVSRVRFDQTSAKACTIDVNVDIASLTVDSSYGGTVSAGASTICINSGDVEVLDGGFDAGTSTLKFVGSGTQYLKLTDLHALENAKTAGNLRFQYNHFSLDTLKLHAGTLTTLPDVGRTVAVNHLDIQGAAGDLARVQTLNAASSVRLTLAPGGTQAIAYAELRDVDASNGCALDASDNCVDAGGNARVYFADTRIWDGTGTTNALSEAANWVRDLAPVSGDQLVFDRTTSKSCTFDQDLTVSDLRQFDNAPAVDFATHTVTVTGDIKQYGSYNSLANGDLVLAGSGRQDLYLRQAPAFDSLTVSNTDGYVNVTRDGFSAGSLTLNAGAKVRLPSNETVATDTFTATGTQQDPVIIDAYLPGQAAGLNVSTTATAAYTAVRNSDAAAGIAVDATNQCADGGGNANWTFDQQNQLITSIVYVPADSAVSPACVEGRYYWFDAGSSVAIDAVGDPVAGEICSDTFFYGNAALNADGTATDVTVTFNNQPGTARTAQIAWTATDMAAAEAVVIRQGDSLRLTANGTGTTLEIDGHGDGTYEAAGAPGDAFATAYPTAGTYTADAKIDGASVGTLTVHVVAMADAPAIGVVHGETRTRQLTVTPAAANADVTLTHVEYLPTLVQSVTPVTGGVDLVIKGAHTGAVKIVARITSATGPILRSYETHAFDMRIVTRKNTPMFKEYNDGDWLTGSAVQMQPHFDGHEVKLRALGGGVIFEATGNDIYWVDTGAFDANSQYPFYLITGGGLTGCHATAEVREQGE